MHAKTLIKRAVLTALCLAAAACGSVPMTRPVMPEPVSAPAQG